MYASLDHASYPGTNYLEYAPYTIYTFIYIYINLRTKGMIRTDAEYVLKSYEGFA